MSTPLQQDIAYIDKIITVGSQSNNNLSEIAQRQFTLVAALTSNSALADSKAWVDTFLAGRVRYDQVINFTPLNPGVFVTYNISGLGSFYGQPGNYYGNLADWRYTNPSGTASYLSFVLTSPTWSISAAPGTTWSDGTTVSAAPASLLKFHAERYAFLCQYLWASPVVSTLSAAVLTPSVPLSSVVGGKFGVHYTATTYAQAATASLIDVDFYSRKKTFISSML